LSRRIEEELVIGRDVRVKVLRITPERVVLGIEAPESVVIARTELLTEPNGGAREGTVIRGAGEVT